ncbi:MAG: tetratricopeptide repeat protein, partial [Alphaproteobacteria bacterium]
MQNFFAELKRRNVVRVALAYAVVSWVILQFVDVIADPMSLPEWFQRVTIILLAILFPIVLIFSWAFEVTPEGVMKTRDVDKSKSLTHGTGQKINKLIAVGFVLALGFIAYDKLIAPDGLVVNQVEAGQASIAVLPFTNLSGLAENDPFTNGLHDDLLTQLSKIESLKVISRTSVLEYRDTTKNMKEIANELGVTTLMEGGIQRVGDRVRINVQLINAATDEHIWAETYDREMTVANIFDVQSEIARNITTALKATFNPEEEARIAEVPTDNLEAYEAYLRGQSLFLGAIADFSVLPPAEAEFKKAIELDPDFAQAWAGLSLAYISQYWWSNRLETRRFLPLAKEAAEKALELKPGLPEGHEALGAYFYWGLLEYEKGIQEFNLAVEGGLRTANLYQFRGSAYRRSGKYWDEAIADFETAVELDPRDSSANWAVASIYSMVHRFEDSRRYLQRAIALDPDSFNYHYTLAAMDYYYLNNPDQVLKLEENDTFEYDLSVAFDYANILRLEGKFQRALDFLEKSEHGGLYTASGEDLSMTGNFYKGAALLGLGQKEEGETFLNLALERIDEILSVTPDFYFGADTKAQIFLLTGRLEEGLELARENRRIKNQEDDAIANLGYEVTLISALAAGGLIDE